jgi:hypothetical protein
VPPFVTEPNDGDTVDTIAGSLFQIMVQEEAACAPNKQIDLPNALWSKYSDKRRLYLEATVLMFLLSQAQNGKKYEAVVQAFEKRIFPGTPSSDGLTKLEVVKHAMKRISELLQPDEGKLAALSWSRTWLMGIGHEEHNPVTLTLFARYWINTFATVGEVMQDFRPLLDESN